MSDLAQSIAVMAERIFADHCSLWQSGESEQVEWSDGLWRAIEESGFSRTLVPETGGGAGGDWEDACALLKRVGEYSVPAPVAETLFATWILGAAGIEAPNGPLTFAIAPANDDFRIAQESGGRWRVNARFVRVPWGGRCAAMVVVADYDSETYVLKIPGRGVKASPGLAISGEPRDDIEIVDFSIPIDCVRIGIQEISTERCFALAALCRAAMMAGALNQILDLCLSYASERQQFGRPINAFQVIRHYLVILAEEVAAANVVTEIAAGACGNQWESAAAAMAKIRAGEAACTATRIAHQIHGAIGVTREHRLHQSTQRPCPPNSAVLSPQHQHYDH